MIIGLIVVGVVMLVATGVTCFVIGYETGKGGD